VLVDSRRILHERTRAHDATVTLRVVDNPPDRPEWLRETIRLLVDSTTAERGRLLGRVAAASEEDLARGSDDDWGLGQVATHLLIVERGVALIGLRLAQGAPSGPTGQPRPAASAVSRAGIASLAEKSVATCARLIADFPAEPDAKSTARHPYYGDLNCFGWLLMLPNHYRAHLEALDRGRPSAL
jgi:DinB family protein